MTNAPSTTALSPTNTPSANVSSFEYVPKSITIFSVPTTKALTSPVFVFTRKRLPGKYCLLILPISINSALPLSLIFVIINPDSSMCVITNTRFAFSFLLFFTPNTEPKLSYTISSQYGSKYCAIHLPTFFSSPEIEIVCVKVLSIFNVSDMIMSSLYKAV